MTVPGAPARPEAHWLAQQLHDTVLQSLAIARMRLDKALTGTGPLPRDLGEDLRGLLDEEIAALRALVRGAGRPAPAQPDPRSALSVTAEHLGSVTGIRVEIDDRTAARRSWARTDLVAYRILREALHNVAKHSGAEHVRVTLADERDHLVCAVRDDGHGFDPVVTPRGFGMTGMYAQAEEAGGELTVGSRRSGTLVRLILPKRDSPGQDRPAPGRTMYRDPALEGRTGDDSARPCGNTDDHHRRRPPGRTVRDPHPPRGRALPDRR